MSSPSNFSLVFIVLPIFAVVGVMAWATPHPFAPQNEPGLLLAVPPSPNVDPAHICELHALIETQQTYDRRAARLGLPRPKHAGLAAEYALIVRETTPGAIMRAGLPFSLPSK